MGYYRGTSYKLPEYVEEFEPVLWGCSG